MRSRNALEMDGIRYEDAGTDDVLEACTGAPERLSDDLEAEPHLLIGIVGRRGAVHRDRRRACDVHVLACHDRTAVAHDRLVGRVSGDRAALHGATTIARVQALRQIDAWPVPFAAAGVVRPKAEPIVHGDSRRVVPLASVSKPVTALALLVAAEEGVVDLDDPAGPPGSTVRHLLAHASGLPFEGTTPIAPPGRRRIYSNEGFRALGAHLEERAEMGFADYVRAAVCDPLGIGLDPEGDPGSGMRASLADVLALARELLAPRLVADETSDEMRDVQFSGLPGVLPDWGRFDPLDWGLGVQLNTPEPTWMGARASRRAFGHFGGSGTFLWVDPEAGVACVALAEREFGDWAKSAWPALSDAVLADSAC